MKEILIGTSNPSKLDYMLDWFAGTDVVCKSPADLGIRIDTAEDAATPLENALQKAKAWHQASGMPVVTEDAGLVFLDLPLDHPAQPGVLVRRAPGYEMNDEEMLAYYAALSAKYGGKLRAAWRSGYCVLRDNDHYLTYEEPLDSLEPRAFLLVDKPCSTRVNGWPINSLSVHPATGKYHEEMTQKELDEVYHTPEREAYYKELVRWIHASVKELLK